MSKQGPLKEVDSLSSKRQKEAKIHAIQEAINKEIDISDGK